MSNDTVRVVKFGEGGVNLNAAARAIRDDQLAWAENVFPSKDGIAYKRPGITAVRSAIIAADGYQCFAFAKADRVTGFDYVAHLYRQSDLHHILVASSFAEINGSFSNSVAIDLGVLTKNAQAPAIFINYRRRIIAIVPEIEGFYHLVPKTGSAIDYEWVKATFAFSPRDFTPSAAVAFDQTQAIPLLPKIAAVYKGRMRYFNFGPGYGHSMASADYASNTHLNIREFPLWALVGSNILDYNARRIDIEALAGLDITAAVEVSLRSVTKPLDSALLVMTENKGVIITGDITQTSDSNANDPKLFVGDFVANKINYDVGCVGQAAITTTPFGTFWAAADDVWALYLNAGEPVRVGTNIKPALLSCPMNSRRHWSMAYADGVLVLSLVKEVSTLSNIDYMQKQQWWLDLRRGPPKSAEEARWFGPHETKANNIGLTASLLHLGPIISDKYNDGSEHVIGMSGENDNTCIVEYTNKRTSDDTPFIDTRSAPEYNITLGDVKVGQLVRPSQPNHSGRIFVCITAGTISGLGEPAWWAGGIINDGTAQWRDATSVLGNKIRLAGQTLDWSVVSKIRTKDYDFGVSQREKIFRSAEITASMSSAQTLSCLLRLNQRTQANTEQPKLGTDDDGQTTRLGEMTLADATVQDEFQARTFTPSEDTRLHGRFIQAEISDDTGFIIDDTNDSLIFGFAADPSGGNGSYSTVENVIQVVLTHGAYANVNALLTEIVSKLNTITMDINWGTFPVNPFSFIDAYNTGGNTYMNRLKMAYTTLTDAAWYVPAFFFGDTDVFGFNLKRSRNLLAMLEFDTNINQLHTRFNVYGEDPEPLAATNIGGATAYWCTFQEFDLVGKFFYCNAMQVMAYRNSVDVSYDEAVLMAYIIKGKPFLDRGR